LFSALWLLAFVTAGATALEFLLKMRSRSQEQAEHDSQPRLSALARAYQAVGIQHLHPQYLFFFPLDPRERVAISNQICSIDADGFRNPGPAHANGRPLAFLLGGSAAFGYYASSDATTIAGYLNRLQDRYFFVSAGVPSWNSTQEMFRLAFQILAYRPALIMTYNGANDAALAADYQEGGLNYPAGTPENFEALSAMVHRKRGVRAFAEEGRGLLADLFHEVSVRIEARFSRSHLEDDPASPALTEARLRAAVARYLSNLARMRDLTTAAGARFVAVFQPVAELHRNLATRPSDDGDMERFHQAAMAGYAHDFEFHDLANIFDEHFTVVPVVDRDISDETVFVDEVHLYDPGNEIVARRLAALLK
jgi:hypothetical protein